jgi:hypothetical protein
MIQLDLSGCTAASFVDPHDDAPASGSPDEEDA